MHEAAGNPSDERLIARVIGVIVAPAHTFRLVVARPRPAGVLFLVCLVVGLATGLPQFTERGRQATLDLQVQQTERFTGEAVSSEAYAQMEAFSRYGGWAAIGSTFATVPVMTMLLAAVLWAAFNTALGGTASFKQVLGTVSHSQVIMALGALVSAPIQHLQGIHRTAGPFNLGALVPMLDPGNPVADFLSGVNFFMLWQMVVLAVGLGALYQRPTRKLAIVLIAVYLVFVAAITAAFSTVFSG